MEIRDFVAPHIVMEHTQVGDKQIYTLGGLREIVDVQPVGKDYQLSRNITGGRTHYETSTTVSNRYLPVSSLSIFETLQSSPQWTTLWEQCDSIDLEPQGGIKFKFGTIYDMPFKVLDITLVTPKNQRQKSNFALSDFHIQTSDLSKVQNVFLMTNSFTKTKAFSLQVGLMRLICTNGLMIPANIGGDSSNSGKHRHYRSNEEHINDLIKDSVRRILEMDEKVKGIKELHQMQLDTTVKDDLISQLQEKLRLKRETKSYKQYQHPIENTYALTQKLLPQCENLLDFQNVISYLTGGQPPRFSQAVHVVANEINQSVLSYF